MVNHPHRDQLLFIIIMILLLYSRGAHTEIRSVHSLSGDSVVT